MMSSATRRTTATLLAFALTACAAHHEAAGTSPQPADQASHSTKTESGAAPARYPYTPADVEFMSHMIGHHAQAIVMSGWAPSHGASPSVRRLAERIINAQQDEIATMQRWLRKRGQEVPEANPAGMKMKMGGSEHPSAGSGQAMLMPGMLTEAQMKQLDQARGEEFDRLFLTFMIQHHRGAVTMVKDLFSSRGAAQDETVFKFANDVSVDQSTEIARMERMLAALPPATSSP
jgi:uncharacterized protein (DUF305 family)